MRNCLFLLLTACICSLSLTACRQTRDSAVSTDIAGESWQRTPPPPLVIDTDAPLLLDEPLEIDSHAAIGADNSPCFVCHANYSEESFAVEHAANDVGCVECHGKSFAHRNDENNTTPPGHMYPPDAIASLCAKCHHGHNVDPKKVIARWQKKGIDKDTAAIVCTDCHGNHRLNVRTVRWNKKTGKLLP